MTEEQLKAALIAAHNKGDKEAAQLFANKIKEVRVQAPAAQQATEQPQERGVLGRLSDVFTGADRQTEETQQLKPVGSSPELNALNFDAAKAALVQTFGSEDAFANKLREMGGKISQDSKGNLIAELPSGRYLVNPPGLDAADVARFGSQAGAFVAGSLLAPQTIVGQAIGGGVTSGALQGASAAAGGDRISPTQIGVDAALGGAGQAFANTLSAGGRLLSRGGQTTPAEQAAKYAEANDLPIMTSDVAPPTTFTGRGVQSVGEKVPFIGTAGARETQQAARQRLITDFSERYGEPSLEEVTSSIKRNANKLRSAAGSRLEQTIRAAGEQPIPLTNTQKAVDDLIANITKPGMIVDDGVVNALRTFKDSITAAPNDLQMLRQNRTLFRELVKGDAPVLSNQADRANKIVYDAMTKDMIDGVESMLGPKVARRMREADAVYAQEAAAIKNTRLKNILAKGDQTPELVGNMLFSKKPSEVSQLYKTLDQKGRENARAAVNNHIFSIIIRKSIVRIIIKSCKPLCDHFI
jgi:hypothetical protein